MDDEIRHQVAYRGRMHRAFRWIAGVTAAIVMSVGVPSQAQAETLAWEACGTDQECSWLTVPLDHANPGGDTIRLRLMRIPARTGASMGSLVVNPGGPGASGVDYVSSLARFFPNELRDVYDLIGFDPRGTGASEPVRCLTDAALARYLRLDSAPRRPADQRRLMTQAARFSPGCLARSPNLAPHMQTDQTVQDMELIRQALGMPTLNFLGFSYGTVLGARYAERYPDTVGRLVLDGPVNTSLDVMQLSEQQAKGFQLALRRFAADCARSRTCQLGRTQAAVLRSINHLLAGLDSNTIPTKTAFPLVKAQAITGIITSLYNPRTWPLLRRAVVDARRGDGTRMQELAYFGNDQLGPTAFRSNIWFAFFSTTCLDSPAPPGQAGLSRAANRWARGAGVPDVSRALAWGNAPCTTWFRHSSAATAVTSTTQTPILVIGTRFDPATPYQWSRWMHRQLPSSTLLTFNGDGHTAFLAGSTCIDGAVTEYLLTGVLPPAGTVC
jgi:pimeloyl-ACP methyl ester carboxylesterase